MDVITVSLLAILIFAVSVALTAFFLKSALDLHNRTVDAVVSHNSKIQTNSESADNKIEERSQ